MLKAFRNCQSAFYNYNYITKTLKGLRKGEFLVKDKKRYIIGGEKMASNTVLKQKEEEVNKLAEKLKDAKVILLTDYRGINVADVTKLRT